jgi:membrane fusion protein, multidrug efflux system
LFVAFFVLVPMAQSLFPAAGIPRRLMPAAITLGTSTFTMSALPGHAGDSECNADAFLRYHAFRGSWTGHYCIPCHAGFEMWWLLRAQAAARDAGEGRGKSDRAGPQVSDEYIRERAAVATEFDPAEVHRGQHSQTGSAVALAVAVKARRVGGMGGAARRQQATLDNARGVKGCRIDPVRVSPDRKPRNNPARSWLHKERESMSVCGSGRTRVGATFVPMLLAMAALLVGCEQQVPATKPEVRPVRALTVEKRVAGEPVIFTGRIEAEDEVNLAFRISGRVLKSDLKMGDNVKAGQVVARLESQNELNALRAAQANLAATQGQLTQAVNHFERQDTLLKQGWTTRANHDQAKQARQTAQSAVDAAQAQLKAAHDMVDFTELKADAPGVVTATGARAGEVVQVGQMIIRLARKDGRDAVFDVPAQVIRTTPSDPEVTVTLTDDPSVVARGRVREVAPQANPATRTFEVKVGLTEPPAAMRLGATVTGRMDTEAHAAIEIPASALTRINQQPAVWVVDPTSRTVSIRNVDVFRYGQAMVTVSGGIDTGEIVVTAGVQALHPGQMVRLLGSDP